MLPAMTFTATHRARLAHEAHHVAWSAEGDALVVVSEASDYSVLDRSLSVIAAGRAERAPLEGPAIDRGRGRLAFCTRGGLIAMDLEGTRVTTHTHRDWKRWEGGDALFVDAGLLTVCPTRDGRPAVQLRDPSNGLTERETPLVVPRESGFSLTRTPDPSRFILWAGAGQDGQWTHEVVVDGSGLAVHPLAPLNGIEHGPLVLGPRGGDAVREAAGRVERWRYPDLVAAGAWEPAQDAAFFAHPDEVQIGPILCFVGPEQVLVQDEHEDRLYLLELDTLRLAHAVRIDELEGRLRQFAREPAGEAIVYVHGPGDRPGSLGLLEPPFGEIS